MPAAGVETVNGDVYRLTGGDGDCELGEECMRGVGCARTPWVGAGDDVRALLLSVHCGVFMSSGIVK